MVYLIVLNLPSLTVAGFDYNSIEASLSFSSTLIRRCVNIPVSMDDLVENSESFTVELSSSSDDVTLGTSMAAVFIVDSDSE